MLCVARDSDSNARSIRSGGKPSPEQETGPRAGQERIHERVRIGGIALGVEQLECGLRVPLGPSGVEVAVDRQLRVARRLQRAVARRRRQRLLATLDRRPAAFAPVVEAGKIEQRSGAQRPGPVGDGEHDFARPFRVAGLDEVVTELERAAGRAHRRRRPE